MEFLQKLIEKFLIFQRKRKSWYKVIRTLECITVAVTTYALILPAISLSLQEAGGESGIVLSQSADAEQAGDVSDDDDTVYYSSEQGESADIRYEEPVSDVAAALIEAAPVLTGTIYPESLDLYAEKSVDAYMLASMPQGASVNVLEDQGDGWLFVSTPEGMTGYVKKAYVLLPGETIEEKKPAMTFELIADRNSPDAEIDEAYIDGTFAGPVKIHVEAPVGAFPVGTTMKVRPVAEEQVREAVKSAIPNPEIVSSVSAVDITFFDACGDEIEPDFEIKVSLTSADISAKQEPVVVHVDDEGQAQVVEAKKEEENVVFESDKFSVYVIVGTTIEKTVLASDGHNYRITATYGPETGIPRDAELSVEEILPPEEGDENTFSVYDEYVSKAENALGMEEGSAGYIRLFDISIVDKNDQGAKCQPAEGTAVEVCVELADSESESLSVVHFADEDAEGDALLAETDGQTVSFGASGFSIYAIVDGEQSTGETFSIKYTFVLEDGTPFYFTNKNGDSTNIQYVKDGEIPINPGTPTVSTGEQTDKEFVGWWTKNGTAWETELSFDTPVSTSSLQEITVYARYDNTQYITYYDENGTVYLVDRRHENDIVLTTDVKNSATGEKWTEEELEDYRFVAYQPLHKTTAFLGWTATQGKNTPDDNFTINEATTLYPVIAEVKWVTYHSGPTGSNATYFGAEYALDGNWERNNLADHIPVRAGYQFDGWYIRNTATQGNNDNLDYSWTVSSADVRVTDANGNFSNGFKNNSTYFENGKLKNNIELVAHWTPTTVDYVFVYYQQEPNTNAEGSYNYVYKDSKTARGVAGTNTGTPPVPTWDDIAGFSLHNTSDSNDPYNVKTEVINGDGSTVVNVYYDRNEYTIVFLEYKRSTGYVVDDSATNNVFGWDGSKYVSLSRKSSTRYYYTYDPGLFSDDIEYTGIFYTRSGRWPNYRYSPTQYSGENLPNNNTTYYTQDGNELTRRSETIYNWVISSTGEPYTGTRFRRVTSNTNGWFVTDELTITAKYGENVSLLWPDKRSDLSEEYPQQWYTSADGSVMQSGIQTMPPNNQAFYNRSNSGTENHMVYWLQNLPSNPESTAPNTFTSVRNDTIYGNSLSTTWDDYSIYEGFKVNIRTQDVATLNSNNGAEVATTDNNYLMSAQIGSSFSNGANRTLNVYYLRNKYSVTFQQDNIVIGSDEYYYEADISGADKYSSAVNVPAGMRFVGWYDNPEGIGDRYTFDGKTMPPNNLILYAKLVPEEYYVRLDYNGGETKGSEATFAWVDYGETIEEAEAVKRNYVEVADGETGTHNYIYWRYDEAADAAGDGWWSYYEDADGNIVYNDPKDYSRRTATYVEAAGGKYKYDPSKYTFVGWYETDEEGNQLYNVPFNFATQITKDTYLKAVFRKEGTFQVRYLLDMGTEGTDGYVAGNPDTVPPTDSYTYIDLSEAKVGHSIEPADNKYQFAGWRVKGTMGPVYQPGQTFPINSDYAEEDGEIQYITLEPVFIQKDDTNITYVINTPTGATATGTALTDLTDNTQDKLILDGSVTLHDGDGFAVTGYKLIGWSDKPLQPSQNLIRLNADGTYEGSIPSDTHIFKPGGKYGVSDEEGNTLYAVWDSNRIEFTKSVSVEGALVAEQVNHTIYIALTKGDKETYVRDSNGNILVKEIQIINGVPTPATVVFDGLEDGNYNVWELKSVDGHRLGVSDVFPIQGANPAANFAVKSISGNNNATVENCSTAETSLTNTYAKEDDTPIRFEVNKVWIDRQANVIAEKDMPENATATISLYRKINGQVETTPIGSVALDGHIDETVADFMEDEPWHASFGNLPRVDNLGNRITYVVKETAATPDGYYPWKQKSQNNDAYGENDYLENSGGTIYNRKLTMSIRLDKHFDFQPNNGDEQAVTYQYFTTDKATQEKLSFTVTLPTGEVRHYKLSDFEPVQGVTTFSLTLKDIPYYTGLYAPEGYNGSTITFQESGEFELLEAYNYYLVNITPDNGQQWNIGSTRPTTVTATRTENMNVNANDPLYEVRIQNKYRRGAEGKFVKLTKKVTGLTNEDFRDNSEKLRNLHFVIQNKAGYYAGLNPTPAFNPATLRYEKLAWVQNVSDAEIISPTFNYNESNGQWEAEFNLSGFDHFPSGEYTIVELESLEGGYNGNSAQIDGYVLTVKDNTITVETHSDDNSNWNDSYDYNLSITNAYEQIVGSVSFTKVDEKDTALPGATFTLYTDQKCTTLAKDKNGNDAIATSAEDTGLVKFENIPLGTYYMKETQAPEGYQVADTVYEVNVEADTSTDPDTGAQTVGTKSTITAVGGTEEVTSIPNVPNYYVSVWKTDMDHNTLTGASFALYKAEDYNDSAGRPNDGAIPVVQSTPVDSNGILQLGQLALGIYKLVETQAPDGYIPVDGAITITVNANAVTAMQGMGIAEVARNVEGNEYRQYWVSGQDEATWQVRVWNNPGVALPSTGGPGTNLIYLLGIMLTSLAGAGFLLGRRKRNTAQG